MRVLLVNDHPPGPGSGAEVYLDRLCSGLERLGTEVEVFAGEIEHRGAAKVLDLWDPLARWALRRMVERVSPDVVHHHNVVRELSVSVLGAAPQVPTVMTVHDHRLLGHADGVLTGARAAVDRVVKSPVDRFMARRLLDLTMAVSESLARQLRAAGFPAVTYVPQPGMQPAVPVRPVEDCRDVVYVGRLARQKGLDVLLEAYRRVAAERSDLRLVVVGEGPDEQRIRRLAGHSTRIQFTGRLAGEELSAAFGSARVVACPSQGPEGGSLVAVEAAMHGRPVVASDVPGLSEVAGRLGADLVPPGDPEAFAAALARLADDAALAAGRGRHAKMAAARHDPVKVAEETLRHYRRAHELRRLRE